MTTTPPISTGVTASVAQTSVNVHITEEVSSAVTTTTADPTLLETIISFIINLF